nr:EOG090X04WQ [Lepidurus arcticus]
MDLDAVVEALDRGILAPLDAAERYRFAQRKVEFLEEFGTSLDVVWTAQEELAQLKKNADEARASKLAADGKTEEGPETKKAKIEDKTVATGAGNILVCGVLVSLFLAHSYGLSSYLTTTDVSKLRQILEASLTSDDLAAVHHSVAGLKALNADIPHVQTLCKKLQANLDKSSTPESAFYVSQTSQALKDCQLNHPANLQQTLSDAILGTSSVADIYHASLSLAALGHAVDSAKTLKALTAALKKDDNINALGMAFHVGTVLNKEQAASLHKRIEDALVQADTVDNKMMQFEGGLSVTALVLSGVYRLSEVLSKSPPLTADQALKFAEYLVSRRSVQTVKGIHYLLDIVNILSSNKFHVPVALSLASPVMVSSEQPWVKVRVTDMLGNSIGLLTLSVTSASRIQDDAVVLTNHALIPSSSDKSLFELNFLSANPSRGRYKIALSASASGDSGAKLVGLTGAAVEVVVLTQVKLEEAEISVADADQSTAPRAKKVTYPSKLSGALEADFQQKVLLRFVLRDQRSADLMTVHQAFVKLTNSETKQEIVFVAEPDINDVYKFDLEVNAKAKEFGSLSGLYTIDVIIGDAVISNPFVWSMADVKLTFTQTGVKPKDSLIMYQPKPEIKHMFREPEVRPPSIVSNSFTLLTALPLVILLGMWMKLGVNVSNFPLSASALAFHVSLGGIFALLLCFWLQLNMFTTLKYLLALGVITFITGNRMLAHMAAQSQKK